MYFQGVIISPYDAIHLHRNLLVFTRMWLLLELSIPLTENRGYVFVCCSLKRVGILWQHWMTGQRCDAPTQFAKKKCWMLFIQFCARVWGCTATHTLQIHQNGFNPSASMSWRDRCSNRRVRVHQADERGWILREAKCQPASICILYIPNNNTSNLFKLKCFVWTLYLYFIWHRRVVIVTVWRWKLFAL